MVLALPWLLASLAIVVFVSSLFGVAALVVTLLLWIASGLLVFYQPMGDVLAQMLFRYRKPTEPEQKYLQTLWDRVASAAGVDPAAYSLWVQDAQDVNAAAAGGQIVAVTSWAIHMLRPPHLAAVLAHELGHHLGGHAWASLLSYWYSLPARMAIRFVTFTVTMAFYVFAFTSLIGMVMIGAILLLAGYVAVQSYSPVLVTLVAIPPVLAYFGRLAELRCDRVAAELGFGPALIEVFESWIEQGHDERRRGLLLATHPTCAQRIYALRDFLASQR